jgi:hypothetical protein
MGMFRQMSQIGRRLVLTCSLAGMLATSSLTRTLQGQEKASTPGAATAPAGSPPAAAAPSFDNVVTSGHQATMMRRIWGIDDLHVRSTASGSLIRFSYRVVDVDKAKILNDKKVNPYLIDE